MPRHHNSVIPEADDGSEDRQNDEDAVRTSVFTFI